jgi:O-antigen ligase
MTFLFVVAGIVGLIWGLVLLIRGNLVAGCMAYLPLTCCFGTYFWQIDLGPTTLSLDRFYLVALAAAFVVHWKLDKLDFKPLTRIDWLFGAFVGVIFVSMITHDFRNTLPGTPPTPQHFINGYLIPTFLYFVVRSAPLRPKEILIGLWTLTGFGVYLAITGIMESQGQWWAVFPRYIANPEIGLHFGRARGPMIQSVSYGMYLASCLAAAWILKDRLLGMASASLWLLQPLFAAAVYLTKTRSVWLGAASALLVYFALATRGKVRAVILGTAIVGGVGVVALKSDAILSMKREFSAAETRKSADMRGSFAYVSWKMFLDYPILGVGFGQFASEKLPYLGDRSVDMDLESIRPYVHHNTFLAVLTEAGLVGLIPFLGMLCGWAYAGVKLARDEEGWVRAQGLLCAGTLAAAFWQMTAHEITFTTFDNSLIYTVAGITSGLYAVRATQTKRGGSPAAAPIVNLPTSPPEPRWAQVS